MPQRSSPESEAAKLIENVDALGRLQQVELVGAIEHSVSICGGAAILPRHLPASVTLPDAGTSKVPPLESALRRWVDDRLAQSAAACS